MILIDGNLELKQSSTSDSDTFQYCLDLALKYKYNDATISQLEHHFKDESYMLYEVWKNHSRIGIAYICKRKYADLTYYTLDGYSDEGSTFSDSIRAGQLVIDEFKKTHDEDILSGTNAKDAGIMLLLRKLNFKPIKSGVGLIIYRHENKKEI